jgi:hypothetical protein
MIRKMIGVGVAIAACLPMVSPSLAVQLADGKTYFTQPPRLMDASASQTTPWFTISRYFFTLELPNNAGEPLQKVVITPEPSVSSARFGLRDSEAYEGTRSRPGAKLSLKSVNVDPATKAVSVVFDPPVQPGRIVTIELFPVRNPDSGGVYLYGVTAFPIGEQPYGQFLGYGRIQIYDGDTTRFLRRRW